MEDHVEASQGSKHQGHPTALESLGLSFRQENKMLCQENSTNEDFDDETYAGELSNELLSTSLS